MLNKKILAATIAAALSTSSFAAVDLDADTGSIVVAAESINSTDLNTTDNMVVLTAGGTELNVIVDAGFSIASSTSKYIRFDLTNAKFNSIVDLDDGTNTAVTTPSAGGVGESYVIFEFLANSSAVAAGTDLTLDATYRITNNSAAGITYKMFETAQEAIDNEGNGLATESGTIASISAALTGTFSTPSTQEAKVAALFTNFSGATLPGTTAATLAAIDADDLLDTTTSYTETNVTNAFDATDIDVSNATLTFSGEFSFGTFSLGAADWSLDDEGNFVVTSTTDNEDGTFTTAYAAGNFAVDTIDTDGVQDPAVKGSYQAVLAGVASGTAANPVNPIPSFTAAAGTITFDTTSIEVPFISTFGEYNQRIYIVNKGSQPAAYTVSFTSEKDVTSLTPGDAAAGTVEPNSVLMIRASELVTLEGVSRTSAVIEVEATEENVSASTQIINTETSDTDTIILN